MILSLPSTKSYLQLSVPIQSRGLLLSLPINQTIVNDHLLNQSYKLKQIILISDISDKSELNKSTSYIMHREGRQSFSIYISDKLIDNASFIQNKFVFCTLLITSFIGVSESRFFHQIYISKQSELITDRILRSPELINPEPTDYNYNLSEIASKLQRLAVRRDTRSATIFEKLGNPYALPQIHLAVTTQLFMVMILIRKYAVKDRLNLEDLLPREPMSVIFTDPSQLLTGDALIASVLVLNLNQLFCCGHDPADIIQAKTEPHLNCLTMRVCPFAILSRLMTQFCSRSKDGKALLGDLIQAIGTQFQILVRTTYGNDYTSLDRLTFLMNEERFGVPQPLSKLNTLSYTYQEHFSLLTHYPPCTLR